jgi:uncharacterized protein
MNKDFNVSGDREIKLFELVASIQRASPDPLLFATLGGSRAFGCASPTSDFDIHGVHLLSLPTVLGLGEQATTRERKMPAPGGAEIELVTHDLKKFVQLLLKGNGNVLEDLFSPYVVFSSPLHEKLKELGTGCITRRVAFHYRGMAQNQQRRMKANNLKQFLHQYRCLLMGIHLMRTGQVVLDLPQLAEEAQVLVVRDLIAWKRAGFDFIPDPQAVEWCVQDLAWWYERLEQVREQSHLPDAPSEETRDQMNRLIIRARLAREEACTTVVQ